jgi:3-hydroxyacyl-CoA dehydrogenase
MQALDQARRHADIRARVLAAKGRTFVAGADVTQFGKPPLSRTLREVIAALDESAKPMVAAINGAGLGGGAAIARARQLAEAGRSATPSIICVRSPAPEGSSRLS